MASLQKLRFISRFLLTLTSVLLINIACIPFGNGHLASLFDDGRDVRLGGYTFRVHPKKGQAKPPTMEHTREARGPLLHSPDRLDLGRLPFLRHPSYTHKYLSNQRLLKFHQGNPPLSSHLRDSDLPTSDDSLERLMNRLGGTGSENEGESSDSPTFTPYISARALSNMEKFFHHLRENLEALQKGDEDGEEDLDSGSRKGDDDYSNSAASPERALASSYQLSQSSPAEWKPRASGVPGLKKIRSFFPSSQNPENRPRLGTNLGLGKRRRR